MNKMESWMPPERCDVCGRFVKAGYKGTSWSQNWSYAMDGSPDLHDPQWRCVPCTEKHGVGPSNCAGGGYQGLITEDRP